MGKSLETKERILRSADKLFREKDFNDVTMKDICEDAQISRGGLYRYFNCIDDVFTELFKTKSIETHNSVMSLLSSNLPKTEIINIIIEQYKKYVCENNQFLLGAMMNMFTSHKGEDCKKIYDKHIDIWVKFFETGQQQSVFRTDVNPVDLSMLLSMVFGGAQIISNCIDISPEIMDNIGKMLKTIIYKL